MTCPQSACRRTGKEEQRKKRKKLGARGGTDDSGENKTCEQQEGYNRHEGITSWGKRDRRDVKKEKGRIKEKRK